MSTFKTIENSTKREWNCRILKVGIIQDVNGGNFATDIGWRAVVDPHDSNNAMILSEKEFAARFTVPSQGAGERMAEKMVSQESAHGQIDLSHPAYSHKVRVHNTSAEPARPYLVEIIACAIDAALAERPKVSEEAIQFLRDVSIHHQFRVPREAAKEILSALGLSEEE